MRRVLLDTGVWIRGMRQREDSDTVSCSDLLDWLEKLKISMVVAAPSIAEVVRGGGFRGPPGLEVVSFDRRAALFCGGVFPERFIEDTRRSMGLREHYIKYDALIVSCAVAGGVDAIVSLDMGLHDLCERARLRCELPADLLQRLRDSHGVDGR